MEVFKPKETYRFTWAQLLVDQSALIVICALSSILAPIALPSLGRRRGGESLTWLADLYTQPLLFILIIAVVTLAVLAVSTSVRLNRRYALAFELDDENKELIIRTRKYFNKTDTAIRIPYQTLRFRHAVGETMRFGFNVSNKFKFWDYDALVYTFDLNDFRWQTRYDKHNLELFKERVLKLTTNIYGN